jgi:cytoskeletal protein CcmA (bactofilin family)
MTWINPINLFGAYEMAFETIFVIRDSAPVLFDLGIAVGATVAMAAVLTFAVGALLRRIGGSAAGALLAALAAASSLFALPARAIELRWDEHEIEVGESEVLNDTLVASGEIVDVNGRVQGDVFAFAERVAIRGSVEGNVFAAAREVLVTGRIEGSLHMAGELCSLEGEVTRNLYGAGEQVTLTETARVGRDVTLAGDGVRVDGKAARDLLAAGSWVEVRGEVGRTARTHSQRVRIFDGARIGGDLAMHVGRGGSSDVDPGAAIGGEVSEAEMPHDMEREENRWLDGGFYLRSFVFVVSAFLVGMLLHGLLPAIYGGALATSGDFWRCLGFGFVALIVTPIALLLCAITVVGIPIAILGVFVYLTVLFVSIVVVAALVGSSITGSDPESVHAFGMALLLGLVIVVAAMNLPFVGGILRLLIALTGMGLLLTTVYDLWRSPRADYA